MIIKQIQAKQIKDSRGEKTIQVIIKTDKGKFKTNSPAGKSTGKYEVKSYAKSLDEDIKEIIKLDLEKINKLNLNKFEDLSNIEKVIGNHIGGNSLFALESSLLKAIAKEKGKELWEFLKEETKNSKKERIRSVGNSIGGGLHSKGVDGKKPDFQEFLFIADCDKFSDCVKWNKKSYNLVKQILKARRRNKNNFIQNSLGFLTSLWKNCRLSNSVRNDEGALETGKSNEEVLMIMNSVRELIKKKYNVKIDIGLDVASSSFYDGYYNYKNPKMRLSKSAQINYMNDLIENYDIFYLEDGLDEEDFSGFRSLKKEHLIVGDDLTTTNPERLKKAIRMNSINGIIVKPNQIGSLLKVRDVIELAKKNKIKTIISHRSGETDDDTIADLGIGFGCDFIKSGIYGRVRNSKLKRIIKIEKNNK